MKQHITEPTRPSSNAVLDLIFTTINTDIHDISVNECFGSSDHPIINFMLLFPSVAVSICHPPKRDYYKAKWGVFSRPLRESIFQDENVDATWSKFKTALANALDVSVPYKKRNSWAINSNSKIRICGCCQQFRILKNKESLVRLIHTKKASSRPYSIYQFACFEKQIINSARQNPKVYWSYVNSKLRTNSNLLNSIKIGDRVVEDPLQIADILNKYFYDNFNHHHCDLSACDTDSSVCVGPTLNNVDINFKIVHNVIKHLRNKYSEDHEGFSYVILKKGRDILIHQLTRLFELSFR